MGDLYDCIELAKNIPAKEMHMPQNTYLFAPYIKYIIDFIEDLLEKRTEYMARMRHTDELPPYPTMIAVELPVQHGKTTLLSEILPAYLIMRSRDVAENVQIITHSSSLSKRIGRNSRAVVGALCPYYGVEVSRTNDSVTDYSVVHSTGNINNLYTATIGGQITGMQATFQLLDDLQSSPSQLNSVQQRTELIDALENKALTRRAAQCITIIVGSRMAKNDMTGYLQETMGEYDAINNPSGVYTIKFPAICTNEEREEEEAIGRHNGEALGESLGRGLSFLHNQRKTVGDKVFNSLYQQDTSSNDDLNNYKADKLIKWGGSREEILERAKGMTSPTIYMSLDIASTTKLTSDYTAITIMLVDKADSNYDKVFYISNLSMRNKVNFRDLKELEKDLYAKVVEEFKELKVEEIIENASNGLVLYEHICDEIEKGYRRKKPIQYNPPRMAKEEKIALGSTSTYYIPDTIMRDVHNVALEGDKTLYTIYTDELTKKSTHDDMADSMAQVYAYLLSTKKDTIKFYY